MAITIQQIKELREATAAGMGACKEALTATNGNMEEAVKYLREKGLAVAAKRVDKESKQGIVALAVAADKKSMALAEVNCEIDFVAKTEAFIKFVDDAAKVALEGKDIEQTLNDDYKMLLTKTARSRAPAASAATSTWAARSAFSSSSHATSPARSSTRRRTWCASRSPRTRPST